MAKKRRNNFRKMNNKSEKNNFQDKFADREFLKGKLSEASKFGNQKCKISTANDPGWYFKDRAVLQDVASFSYGTPVGAPLHVSEVMQVTDSQFCATVPGLLTMHIVPGPGVATNDQDPVNLAATNVYAYVRYKNSGAKNYDSPDLMMYLLAMDSIYGMWNWMKRIYGYTSTYSSRNKYLPRAIVEANGVDFDDILRNLADFRAYLNMKTFEITAFNVPATMTYMVRHSWLFSNVYKDSNTAKAQMYMYVPEMFYQYDETTSERGSQLVPVPITADMEMANKTASPTLLKFKDLVTLYNSMLAAMNYSEDVGVISGDILKAYEGNLFTISTIDPDFKLEPVYSEEVLTQIENASLVYPVTNFWQDTSWYITQDPDTNYIKYQPHVNVRTQAPNGYYVNFHKESIQPEDSMVATRLICTVAISGNADYNIIESCGSEIFTRTYMYFLSSGQNGKVVPGFPSTFKLQCMYAFANLIDPHATTLEINISENLAKIAMLATFDWAPVCPVGYYWYDGNGKQHASVVGFTRDWDMYAVLSEDDIRMMNLLALLTEFNVPN